MWSLSAHAFVPRYKLDVLASVAASFGREGESLSHFPWYFLQVSPAPHLPLLITSQEVFATDELALGWSVGEKEPTLFKSIYPFLKGK